MEAAMPRWSESWPADTSWRGWRRWHIFIGEWTRSCNSCRASNTEPCFSTPPRRPYQTLRQLHLHVLCVHAHRIRHGHRPRPSPRHGSVPAATGHGARQSAVHSVGVRDVWSDRHSADVRDGLRSFLSQTQVVINQVKYSVCFAPLKLLPECFHDVPSLKACLQLLTTTEILMSLKWDDAVCQIWGDTTWKLCRPKCTVRVRGTIMSSRITEWS